MNEHSGSSHKNRKNDNMNLQILHKYLIELVIIETFSYSIDMVNTIVHTIAQILHCYFKMGCYSCV